MIKRSICAVLALFILLSLAPAALAANPSAMTDITSHWAKEHIFWVMEEGLFNGVSETKFDPNGSMTRGMFVTVLGRLAQADPEKYNTGSQYSDVTKGAYYTPYINWATANGIANGTSSSTFSPDTKVTRQQMAAFIVRFAEKYSYELTPITGQIVSSFTDRKDIADYAKDAVEIMRTTGLLNGYANADGTYAFKPEAFTTRAECATIFRRLSLSIFAESDTPAQPSEPEQTGMPTAISLSKNSLVLRPSETAKLSATVSPDDATDKSVTWVSSNNSVATVTSDGAVTHISPGQAVIYAYTSNDLSAVCRVYCSKGYVGSASDTYAQKCIGIFGEYVVNPRTVYSTAAEAKEHMVEINVKVWDFNTTKTAKVTKTRQLTIHENLAETVTLIFDEIYRCSAMYPINSIGGYAWRGSSASEHTPGLAIDVNYMQNYYCDAQGNAITGSHFDPENDPYSMPVDGEIQKIFEKYGFIRGIYWSSGKKDYMHYSFFGT